MCYFSILFKKCVMASYIKSVNHSHFFSFYSYLDSIIQNQYPLWYPWQYSTLKTAAYLSGKEKNLTCAENWHFLAINQKMSKYKKISQMFYFTMNTCKNYSLSHFLPFPGNSNYLRRKNVSFCHFKILT